MTTDPRPKHVHTIEEADVGKASHKIAGRTWRVSDWIGSILPSDVGKRVYLVTFGDAASDAFLQVENDEQRDRREVVPASLKDFVCGTRRVVPAPGTGWRVVCATCGAGGSRFHRTRELATRAAVRDSARRCAACGAD